MQQRWPLDISVSFDPYFGEPSRDGEQGAEILPDGRVFFRIPAPQAQEVTIDRFGTLYPLTRNADGVWEATLDLGRGFIYFFLKIDGADVLCPYLPIGYGCCRPMNFVDVPEEDMKGWDDLEKEMKETHSSLNARCRYPALCALVGHGKARDLPGLHPARL